jgi:predicted ATPase
VSEPEPLTPFIGREETREQLLALLADGVRLLTISGTGGIGKTRLARETLGAHPETWSVCDLSEVDDEAGLLAALAAAIDVPLSAPDGGSVARALEASGARVLLDNFDELVRSAAGVVGELLAAAPACRLVVTSRVPLGVSGETVFDTPPLAPEAARELFLARARALRRDLDDDDETRASVDEATAACDGMPLAIELLAARVSVLTPADIARRARESLDVFRDKRADRPERHQTLRAAIAASWELLDDVGRSALCQLGAFAGGFTVDAAERVVSLPDGAPPALDVISDLQAASLIARDPLAPSDGPSRLRLLETIRAFVRESSEVDTLERAKDAHRAHFAERARAWSSVPSRAHRLRLQSELENVRAATAWAIANEHPDALVLADALSSHTARRGPFADGLRALEACRGFADRAGPFVRASWLRRLAEAVHDDGRLDEAFALTVRCVELMLGFFDDAERGDDARRIATLGRLLQSHTLLVLGRPNEARAVMDETLGWADSPWPRCAALDEAGEAAMVRGDFTAAEVYLEEGLALAREIDADLLEGDMLSHLGVANHRSGNFERAARWFEEAAAVNERTRDLSVSEQISTGRWLVSLARGHYDDAVTYSEETADLALQIGAPTGISRSLGDRGLTLLARGDHVEARDQLTRAVPVIANSGTKRMAANYAAFLACAHALCGEIERARISLEHARALTEAPVPLQLCKLAEIAVDACEAHESEPGERASVARACEARLATWMKERPSAVSAVLTAIGQRLVERAIGLLSPGAVLAIEGEATRFRLVPGDVVDMSRRAAPRLLLWALARAHRAEPESRLTVAELFAEGWPEEKAVDHARKNRVQVAISTLRSAGLKEVLEGGRDGYRLRPDLVVTFS